MHVLRLVPAAFAACLLAPVVLVPSARAQAATTTTRVNADEPRRAAAAGAETAGPAAAKDDNRLRWLDPVAFAPGNAFAPPPAPGSIVEKLEFERLRALIRAATPERLAAAAWDNDHEEPIVFGAAAGRDFAKLPATTALLATIAAEVERVVVAAKVYYKRQRPYQLDPALPHCGAGTTAPTGYPSGHSGYGWAVGWTLARLLPERAPAILARAQDFGLSRELCGSHFASDLEASHGAATAAAERLMADPRLAPQVAAARAELARH